MLTMLAAFCYISDTQTVSTLQTCGCVQIFSPVWGCNSEKCRNTSRLIRFQLTVHKSCSSTLMWIPLTSSLCWLHGNWLQPINSQTHKQALTCLLVSVRVCFSTIFLSLDSASLITPFPVCVLSWAASCSLLIDGQIWKRYARKVHKHFFF